MNNIILQAQLQNMQIKITFTDYMVFKILLEEMKYLNGILIMRKEGMHGVFKILI